MLIILHRLLFDAEVTMWECALTGKPNIGDCTNMTFDPSWINDETFMRFQGLQQQSYCMTAQEFKEAARRAGNVAHYNSNWIELILDTDCTKAPTLF